MLAAAAVTSTLSVALMAQAVPAVNLPSSPRGLAAIQVGGAWTPTDNGPQYRNGKWITIDYGRPILRGRPNIFGSGAEYGRAILDGSPVWRAGANATTRLTTQAALDFGGTTVQPGVYNVLVDLKPEGWTMILSTQPVQAQFNPEDKVNLYGGINYDPKFDVLRVPMVVDTLPVKFEQFTIDFGDVTTSGGTLMMFWETTGAFVNFAVK
jgi:hypothetical protein